MLIVAFFIHLVNVLLQNRFTCFHLVGKFLTQPAFGVQASCVVNADQDPTTDAKTAVFAPLDYITISMTPMVPVNCVRQVTSVLMLVFTRRH